MGKTEREMQKARHIEGTCPHLLLPNLQSPGGRMCPERKAQGKGTLTLPCLGFGEGHCEQVICPIYRDGIDDAIERGSWASLPYGVGQNESSACKRATGSGKTGKGSGK